MDDLKFEAFPVPIWGYVNTSEKYQASDYVDYIIEMAKTQPSVTKSNMGGWQSHDDIHNTEGIFREMTNAIGKMANVILKEYNCAPVTVKEMWANVNGKGCSNGAHIHSGIISGVFYLQVPPGSGNLVLINPAVRSDGHIIRAKNFSIKPEKLAVILFPSWLEHYVEPNLSDDLRISISFNIGVA